MYVTNVQHFVSQCKINRVIKRKKLVIIFSLSGGEREFRWNKKSKIMTNLSAKNNHFRLENL